MLKRRVLCIAIPGILLSTSVLAQGYYISRTVTYPDAMVTTDPVPVHVSPNRDEVAAIGMGKTQVGNGREFNAMMYNPALLTHERVSVKIPDVQLGIPSESVGAFTFLGDNIDQFTSGRFLQDIYTGIDRLINANSIDEQFAALQMIEKGLQFTDELQKEVGGTIDNPRTHGVTAIPGVQVQVNNWGFSVYGVSQTGFQLQSGQAVTQLAALDIPSNVNEVTPEFILQLLTAVAPLIDENGNIREDALPEVYAMSYLDIVGAVGYAHDFSEHLSVGTALKVVNRRFSTKRIAVDNYDNIFREARKDFEHSLTGFTLDLGTLWKVPETGLEVGVSLQNLIPMNQISSTANIPLYISAIQDYDRDQAGNPIVTNGDTALVVAEQSLQVHIPFELEVPLIASVGSSYRLMERWDVALDWVDIGEQDSRYETTADRIRLGTEYRLTTTADGVGVAFRAGMAELQPTFGIGINFFDVVRVDGAYAPDPFVGEPSYFAQIGIGW